MFMDTQEVVVVTINYRLSALGWLVLKEEGVEGNQVGVKNMNIIMNYEDDDDDGTRDCWTWWRRCTGCRTISGPSEEILTRSL